MVFPRDRFYPLHERVEWVAGPSRKSAAWSPEDVDGPPPSRTFWRAFVALPAGTTNGRIAGTMAKTKISISVDAQVLERAKELTPDISRSELIEVALRSWARAQRRKQVEDEVARYYASLSKEDHEQDEAWARLGEEALASGD